MNNELVMGKIAAIDTELSRRRTTRRLDYYNRGEKVHVKQLEFHRSQKRNRWVFGGNRSGKTECGAVECVYMARGVHPYRENRDSTNGWVVSLSTQVQRDVAQQKVLSYLRSEWIRNIVMLRGRQDNPSGGVIDYIEVENVSGKISRIGFKSCDQGREKFQGASLDYVWFDEEPPKAIYEECRMRILDRRGDIFATMTPLLGLSWVYYDIYQNTSGDKNVQTFSMEWADNPYLSAEEIADMTASLSREALDSRRYGRFSEARGLVYPEFCEDVNVIEPFDIPHEWQDTLSIDPGLNNPLSCHWYATDYDGNVYVLYEHYEAGRNVYYHAKCIHEICEKLRWKKGMSGRVNALIDSAATQRTLSATRSVAELFYDHGINVNTHVNKDLFAGINRVRRYLSGDRHPKLYIFSNCVNLIREIKGYFYGSGDVPRKRDDHALDELRYYIMSRPEAAKYSEKVKSDVLKEKERLIRKLAHGR